MHEMNHPHIIRLGFRLFGHTRERKPPRIIRTATHADRTLNYTPIHVHYSLAALGSGIRTVSEYANLGYADCAGVYQVLLLRTFLPIGVARFKTELLHPSPHNKS